MKGFTSAVTLDFQKNSKNNITTRIPDSQVIMFYYVLAHLLICCFCLLGCSGGFSDSSSDTKHDTNILFSGQARFPVPLTTISSSSSAVQASALPVFDSDSGYAMQGGLLQIYDISDFFFQKNLLRSDVKLYTDEYGNFAVLPSELQNSALPVGHQEKAFILRISFAGLELYAPFCLSGRQQTDVTMPKKHVLVNAKSDGPISYLKSELFAAGIFDAQNYQNVDLQWKNRLELLALDFAKKADGLQDWPLPEGLSLEDYHFNQGLYRFAGQKWVHLFPQVDHQVWSKLYTKTVYTAISTPLNPHLSAAEGRKRQLNLLYGALELGFCAIDAQGKIFMKDDIQELDQHYTKQGQKVGQNERKAPMFTVNQDVGYVRSATEFAGLIEGLQDTDASLPIPEQIISFTIADLAAFGQQTASGGNSSVYAEKMVLLARKGLTLPWIVPRLLPYLASGFDIGAEQFFRFCCQYFQQKRYVIERQIVNDFVPTIFLGPAVIPSLAYGSHSMSPDSPSPAFSSLWTFWRQQNFQTDFSIFYQNFIFQPPFYFRLFPDFYRLQSSNPDYSPPFMEKKLLAQLFQSLETGIVSHTATVARELAQIERSLEPLWVQSQNDNLKPDTIFPLLRVFSSLVFPLQGAVTDTDAFYQALPSDLQGAVTPYLENIAFSGFPVSDTFDFWFNLLSIPDDLPTQPDLSILQTAFATLSVSEQEHLTFPIGTIEQAFPSGRVILGLNVQNEPLPAENFPIFALAMSENQVYVTKTDEQGYYSFAEPLSAPKDYRFYVELKDILPTSLDATHPLTVSFPWYFSGNSRYPELPTLNLESELKIISTTFVARRYQGETVKSLIQARKTLLDLQLEFSLDISSGVIPISFVLFDEYSERLDLVFSFTSGNEQLVTSELPRISSFATPVDFPEDGILSNLPSAPLGFENTIYWHTNLETGLSGSMTNSERTTVQFCLRAFSRLDQMSTTAVCSSSFILDYAPPSLELLSPLDTDSPLEAGVVRVHGQAFDDGRISFFTVVNLGHSTTVYDVVPLTDNYQTWEIVLPVVSGIKNTLVFSLGDEFGNTTTVQKFFFSKDQNPPLIQLSGMEVLSLSYSLSDGEYPQLKCYAEDELYQFVVPVIGASSIVYPFHQACHQIELPVVTSRMLLFRGEVFDEGKTNKVALWDEKTGFDTMAVLSVENDHEYWTINYEIPVSYTSDLRLRLYAVDEFENSSLATAYLSRSMQISIAVIDLEAPVPTLVSPLPSSLSVTLTSSEVILHGTAADASRIVEFVLCSPLSCRVVESEHDYLDWQVLLPLAEAATNPITGYIKDEFGFTNIYSFDQPFQVYNLNDLTPPVFTIDTVNRQTLEPEIYVDQGFPSSPRQTAPVFTAACVENDCTVEISGFISDASGLDLCPDALGENFSGLMLRLPHYGADGFMPDILAVGTDLYGDGENLFNNQYNKTTISINPNPEWVDSLGRQIKTSYTAALQLDHDGYWPLWVMAYDNATELFSPFTRAVLSKRELAYFKRDTQGPQITSWHFPSAQSLTGLMRADISLSDELSDIVKLQIWNDDGAVFTVDTDFISQEHNSDWLRFLFERKILPTEELPSLSSVKASLWLTQKGGYDREFRVMVWDSLENKSQETIKADILPLFLKEIKPAEPTFPNVRALALGNGENFVLADNLKSIQRASVDTMPIIGADIFGNQQEGSSFYTSFSQGENIGLFSGYDLQNAVTVQSLFIHAIFTSPLGDEYFGLLRLQKDQDRFICVDENLSSPAYHVFRETPNTNQIAVIPSEALFCPSPLLENVVYVYQPQASGHQLFRFVNGFRDSISLATAQGGSTASTGAYGLATHQLAEVVDFAIAQTHHLAHADPSQHRSDEYLYLARQQPAEISRFHYRNLALADDEGFHVLPPLSLNPAEVRGLAVQGLDELVIPTAVAVELDGSFLYVGDLSQKIYKIALSSTTASLVCSFGMTGVGDGRFLSIDRIYGEGADSAHDQGFLRLYVLDKTAAAISVWTTEGQFLHHYGHHDYSFGSLPETVFLATGGVGNGLDETATIWYTLDQKLDALTFYNQNDEPNKRISAADLFWTAGFSLVDRLFISQPYQPDIAIHEFMRGFFYQTADQIYFSAQSLADDSFSIPLTVNFADDLTNLRDVIMVEADSAQGIMLLETISPTQNRVQWYGYNGDKYGVMVNNPVPADKLCHFANGLVLIGSSSQLMLSRYTEGGVMGKAAGFEPVELIGFLGENISLSAPSSVACNAEYIFVTDHQRLLGFQTPRDYGQGLESRLVQELSFLGQLSASTSLMLRQDFLYVLDQEAGFIRKYLIK